MRHFSRGADSVFLILHGDLSCANLEQIALRGLALVLQREYATRGALSALLSLGHGELALRELHGPRFVVPGKSRVNRGG